MYCETFLEWSRLSNPEPILVRTYWGLVPASCESRSNVCCVFRSGASHCSFCCFFECHQNIYQKHSKCIYIPFQHFLCTYEFCRSCSVVLLHQETERTCLQCALYGIIIIIPRLGLINADSDPVQIIANM